MLAGRRGTLTDRPAARRERDAGAVLVETALVLPLFVILVFGIIEFSVAFRSSAVLSDTSRAAGRAAAKVGDPQEFDTIVARAADAAVSNLPSQATPRYLLIYPANEQGLPGSLETGFKNHGQMTSCGGVGADTCWVMAWNPELERFEPTTSASAQEWSEANVCTPPYDRVGVAVFADFRPLTNLFGPLLERTSDDGNWDPLTDVAVYNFDPDLQASCDDA